MSKSEPTRVLVIDDDVAVTDMLRVILEPMSFEVVSSASAEDGINAAHRFNPDVVVLDLFMPGMDGWEVCRAIRKFSKVPILVLTAMSKPGMVVKALNEGADDYLIKPVASSVLVAHLRNLSRRARAEKEAVESKTRFKFGNHY
ncbi:MAG: response regulator transcription factor [Anaerolineales bacterium]